MNTALLPKKTLRARPKTGLGMHLIDIEEEKLVLEVLRSKKLFRYTYDLPREQQGKMSAALEREACALMGVKYALAVTSGTGALEVSLAAMGVGPGDEVILPAWSWISCFTSIVRVGALPVLAEIDETLNLAPGEIKRLTNERTKAVLIMHYQGVAADMEPLMKEARDAGLQVLEDCAQSPGAIYHGKRVGSFGDMGIYSFQINKSITSGEGGMVVTSDPDLYERAVRMHDLGLYREAHRVNGEPRLKDFCGGQYRMNEITAAVALAQLRKLDAIRNHCRDLNARILQRIGSLPGLVFRRIPDPEGDSCFEIYFYLQTPELANAFSEKLKEKNVNCTKTTGTYCQYTRGYCIDRLTSSPAASPFRGFREWPAPGYRACDFPRTESLAHRFVCLPLGVLYTADDADYIAESVEETYAEMNLGQHYSNDVYDN